MMSRLLLTVFVLLLHAGTVFAVIESYEFQTDEQRERYQRLTEELRCPKCQNQNLADSDAQIAADLRRELHAQLLAGKSDEVIVDFMRERYGDFVLYKPRVQASTIVLWTAPALLLIVVACALWWSRREQHEARRAHASPHAKEVAEDCLPSQRLPVRAVHLLSLLALLAVLFASLLLYRQFGAARAVVITEQAQQVFSGELSGELLATQQQQLLTQLDGWLADHPDDEKFLYMRARLLGEGGDWERAEADYRALLSRYPEQDSLLAEYAQLLFLKNGRSLTDDAEAFLQQALQINPHNATALGLLGMQAFEAGDYRKAVDYWQRLLAGLPPGSAQAQTIASGIARAQELGGLPQQQPANADLQLTVQVSIAAIARAQPDETVFVLLRAAQGPRMPLAVVRTTVAALSQPVLLDTAQSPMRGQIDIGSINAFEVVARLSRSGQPQAMPGDWDGSSESLTRAAWPARLAVTIERAVQP